jgi:beta-N-acetylhexosaminidase
MTQQTSKKQIQNPPSIGPLMIDIAGQSLTEEDKQLLANPAVGGLIIFSRNYESPEQIQSLIKAIRAAAYYPNLLIAVDQEGGRVQRFKKGFTRLPAMRKLGELYDRDPQRACMLLETTGWLMAMELLAVGVDISFAPVLDLDLGVSEVIGDRAFHSDPEIATSLAEIFIHGMLQAGMQATGKHFPGHGSVAPDSHLAIPYDDRKLNEVEQLDLQPFELLIKTGIGALMMAHIVFPEVDDKPVGFSSVWMQEILRQQLNFQGVVFSDDLSMEGASAVGNMAERAALALQAGCDMILLCNNRAAVLDVLDQVKNLPSNSKLSSLSARPKLSWSVLQENPNWQNASRLINEFNEEVI